jgi:hypothetical protein
MSFIFSVLFFIIGLILRPFISRLIKSQFGNFFLDKYKRFEIVFKIEFYSKPSIHHLGEEGMLVKSEPVKVQIDAENEDDALEILDGVIKQEIKAELVSIKEIQKF